MLTSLICSFEKSTSYAFKISIVLSLIFTVAGLTNSASAQESVGNDTTVVYPASYFAEYAPVSALDMLNRIPGMDIQDPNRSSRSTARNPGRGGRGLGSGSSGTQVMINGKRTAGKNNNSQTQLVRINADQVDYIEIIRGTGGDLDVRGSTQIANIVLFEQLSNTSLSYEINTDYYSDDESEPGGSLSYGGQTGNLNFLVSAIAQPQYQNRISNEKSFLPDNSPNDIIKEDRTREQTSYTLSTNLDYQLSDKSSVRFNALYAENDDPTFVDRATLDLVDGVNIPFWEREDIPSTNSNWEVGGDFEYRFDNGNRFKALLISNETDIASIRKRFDVFADGTETQDLYLDSASIAQERIVRASYTMDVFNGQDLEFGAERAQTILDSNLRLALPAARGTPSAAYDGLVPQMVPNANTRVEEIRYEPFAIHNWRINSRMSLETSMVYEFSKIEQSGDFNNKRDFSFFKPKIDYRFDITPQLQLRFLIEKFVRQISFTDFVASTDAEDDDSNTLAGNTALRPDFWWNYNLLAEYRLPNDAGVVTANLYKHRHNDFLQRIDVSTSSDNPVSAAGNTGKGDMVVFEVKGSVRMNMINMPNLLVTTKVAARDSQFKDPFLNITRRFNNYHRGEFDSGFRHDLPKWKLNWGVNMINRIDGATKRWDIDDIEEDHADPYITAFVEKIAFNDITFRLDMRNVSDVKVCRDRTRYVGHIANNVLEELEFNCWSMGRTISLKMSGTF